MTGTSSRELARYLFRHPRSLAPLARAGWRLRANGWWRRAPYLPLPATSYWDFRVTTARGEGSALLEPRAIVEAATWASHQRVSR